jgi:hypothetical protein
MREAAVPDHHLRGKKTSMADSTNGNVQFSTTRTAAFANDCLPSQVAPGQGDLPVLGRTSSWAARSATRTCSRVSGASLHKPFILSWQVQAFDGSDEAVNAQIVFKPGSENYRVVYAPDDQGASATIGIQASLSTATQFTCNSGGNVVTNGESLTFTHV